MSRSGYDDCIDSNWELIKYRGQVASAIRGRRGQKLFRDLATALDAMPEKQLTTRDLECRDGVCALGCLGRFREMNLSEIDAYDADQVASRFDIAPQLAREIVWENDEAGSCSETPEARWRRMRNWVGSNLKESNKKQ